MAGRVVDIEERVDIEEVPEWYTEVEAPLYGDIQVFDPREGDGLIQVHTDSESLDFDLRVPYNSENEDEVQSMRARPGNAGEIDLGKQYSTVHDLRKEVKDYSLKHRYDIKIIKCTKTRFSAKCRGAAKTCKWRLHASLMQNEDTIQIKTFAPEHICKKQFINRHATALWVANTYARRFRSQPNWPIRDIIKEVRIEHQLDITKSLARRAKEKAKDLNFGRNEEQLKLLRRYQAEILKSNPGSTVDIHGDLVGEGEEQVLIFKRMYMCLAACKEGLIRNGRPVICIDGCHLKGSCPGQLLTAVGIDGNNGMYPFAVANVEIESQETWKWFLKLVQSDLGLGNGQGWTFVSDRQKGLINAVVETFPGCEHRYCQRHMYLNYKAKFPGEVYKQGMWKAARATTREYFEIAMRELYEVDRNAYLWLQQQPPRLWATHAFSSVPKCELGLNNLCETYNSTILAARSMPILTMFEMIRKAMMTRIVTRYQASIKNIDGLCPRIREKLDILEGAAVVWTVELAGPRIFEVSAGIEGFTVDLNDDACSCLGWEYSGIPCVHAVAAMHLAEEDADAYVNAFYHRDTYTAMYSSFIRPISGQIMWPQPENRIPILPPEKRPQPGRPKNKRRRDVDEPSSSRGPHLSKKKTTVSCTKCGRQGHNKRTCKETTSTAGPRKRRTFMGLRIREPTHVHEDVLDDVVHD